MPAAGRLIANIHQLTRQAGQPGTLVLPDVVAPSQQGLTPAAQQSYWIRYVPDRRQPVAKIGFVLATASGSNDAVDVGIATCAPGSAVLTLVASSGSTSGKANGTTNVVQSCALPSVYVLKPGQPYYIGWGINAIGGTSPVLRSLQGFAGNNQASNLFGLTAPNADMLRKDGVFPLATNTPTSSVANVPVLVLLDR